MSPVFFPKDSAWTLCVMFTCRCFSIMLIWPTSMASGPGSPTGRPPPGPSASGDRPTWKFADTLPTDRRPSSVHAASGSAAGAHAPSSDGVGGLNSTRLMASFRPRADSTEISRSSHSTCANVMCTSMGSRSGTLNDREPHALSPSSTPRWWIVTGAKKALSSKKRSSAIDATAQKVTSAPQTVRSCTPSTARASRCAGAIADVGCDRRASSGRARAWMPSRTSSAVARGRRRRRRRRRPQDD